MSSNNTEDYGQPWRQNASYFTVTALFTTHERIGDFFMAVLWFLILIYAVVVNVTVILAILQRSQLRSTASYQLMCSLALCHIAQCLLFVLYILPLVLFHDFTSLAKFTTNTMAMFVFHCFFYCSVLHLAIIAISRFTITLRPEYYETFFSSGATAAWIFLAYAAGVAAAAPLLLDCCHQVFVPRMYFIGYVKYHPWHIYLDFFVCLAVVLLMIAIYIPAFISVRKSRKVLEQFKAQGGFRSGILQVLSTSQERRHRREFQTTLQFIVVSIYFCVVWAGWESLRCPLHSAWINAVFTTLLLLFYAATPTVYLMCNEQLREQVTSFIPRWEEHVKHQPTVSIVLP